MGYRDKWLSNAGSMSRHFEVTLHALDRELPTAAVNVLMVGVENGGTIEVLQDVLAEGSSVLGIDSNPACSALPFEILTGDVLDDGWVRGALRDRMFEVIVDCTGTMTTSLWPFLSVGGKYFFEGYQPAAMTQLVTDVAEDQDSWLPTEEIMRVTVFPKIAVVEKRHPRVLDYIEIMTGNFADVVDEDDLISRGVRRVLVD